MKKSLKILIVLIVVLCLSGCGEKEKYVECISITPKDLNAPNDNIYANEIVGRLMYYAKNNTIERMQIEEIVPLSKITDKKLEELTEEDKTYIKQYIDGFHDGYNIDGVPFTVSKSYTLSDPIIVTEVHDINDISSEEKDKLMKKDFYDLRKHIEDNSEFNIYCRTVKEWK